MVDTTLDTRRLTREHEQNLANATNVSFNMVKPWLQFNMAACRFYTEGWTACIDNMEKVADVLINMADATQQEINKAHRSA